MSEIEDVGATSELLPKLSDRRLDSRTSRDQQDGIEIPLHCSVRLQAVAGITWGTVVSIAIPLTPVSRR